MDELIRRMVLALIASASFTLLFWLIDVNLRRYAPDLYRRIDDWIRSL